MSPLQQVTMNSLKRQYDLLKQTLEECSESMRPSMIKEMRRELKLIYSIYHNETKKLRNLFDRYNESSLQLLDELMTDNSNPAYLLRNGIYEESSNNESVRQYSNTMKNKHDKYKSLIEKLQT
jgi:hypothetical protein